MKRLICLSFLTLVAAGFLPAQASTPLESIINHYLEVYPFSPENAFRLGVYLELKGEYNPDDESMTATFGELAHITFNRGSVLLRAGRFGVYSLNEKGNRPADIDVMNQALSAIFEQVFLMGNVGANRNLVRLVDRYLIRKNLTPFDKILLHHILTRFGRYDSLYNRVEIKTEWFPQKAMVIREYGHKNAREVYGDKLYLKLDKGVIRGYYLRAGGTVYVEDVERDVLYATGEVQSPSSTAFKFFVQQLYTQSTSYLIEEEQRRLAQLELEARLPNRFAPGELPLVASNEITVERRGEMLPRPSGYQQQARNKIDTLSLLYQPYQWVPMMVGILRDQDISIADPDILPYFIHASYFDFLYNLLTPDEQAAVARWREDNE